MEDVKVIFLDIDGVVNIHNLDIIKDKKVNNRESIELINKLCLETNAFIVITSSLWRGMGLSYLKELFLNSGLLPSISIIDTIPLHYSKEEAIDRWLTNKPYINDFVIIDDEDTFDIYKEKLVKCNGMVGFTMDDYINALNILNKSKEIIK